MIKNTECMSNFMFQYVGSNTNNLESALKLALARYTKVKSWKVEKEWLVFCWLTDTADKNVIPFPIPLESENLVNLVKAWLDEKDPADDITNFDGSIEKGYEILTLSDNCNSYEAFRVRPIWALFGK